MSLPHKNMPHPLPRRSYALAVVAVAAILAVCIDIHVLGMIRNQEVERQPAVDIAVVSTSPVDAPAPADIAEPPVAEMAPHELPTAIAPTIPSDGPPQPVPVVTPAAEVSVPAEVPAHDNSATVPDQPHVATAPSGKARVAIIIDDMGMDVRHSRQIIALPAPLTLSFLPYAPEARAMAQAAAASGHELMIHMPMEPMKAGLNMGPIALHAGMDGPAFDSMLAKAYASFDGYVGMNNHMGSRLTQDRDAMRRVMRSLKVRNLYFIDSRTIGSSVAEDEAAKAGLRHGTRDVFLDDDNAPDAVAASLGRLEAVAHRKGYAIAIGHPRPATIAALKGWIATANDKNIEIVPASALLQSPAKAALAVSQSGGNSAGAPASPLPPPPE